VSGAAAHGRAAAAEAAASGGPAAPAGSAPARRAELQERDDVGGGEEGVGDRLAGGGRDGGDEAAVGLGHEQRTGRDVGGVELGDALEFAPIGATGAPSG
jgi:hypothetical protein